MQVVKNQETQPDALFTGGEETKTRENLNHLDIFWQAQKQLENIAQMHFSCGEKGTRGNRPDAFSGGEEKHLGILTQMHFSEG